MSFDIWIYQHCPPLGKMSEGQNGVYIWTPDKFIIEYGRTQPPTPGNWKPGNFELDKTSDESYFESKLKVKMEM
ncbi:hypothetical protein DRQ19_03255 [bacterium]|nr:MAG: hypothetical protein DRQ19_03255 [bacterium]